MHIRVIRFKLLFSTALAVLLVGCMHDDPLKLSYPGYVPSAGSDGWSTASPSDAGMDSVKLDSAYRRLYTSGDFTSARSMVVVRRGKLVGEAYCTDLLDRTRPNAIWSCTKSVTSLVTGFALRDGYIDSLDDPIEKYLPQQLNKHPEHKGITIRNLLTMRAGIDFNAGLDEQTGQLLSEIPDDCVDYILSNKQIDAPGPVFSYNNGVPTLLSAVIQSRAAMNLGDYARKKLFEPLGISNYKWDNYRDGVTLGAYGLWMIPRDLAKIGWMVCDTGKWAGRQIVSPDWIWQSATGIMATTTSLYGFYWWIDAGAQCVYMAGHGGQFVFVVPEKQLVVVITSDAFTQGAFELALDKAQALLHLAIESCR